MLSIKRINEIIKKINIMLMAKHYNYGIFTITQRILNNNLIWQLRFA